MSGDGGRSFVVIGLAGGIGSGKSAAARALADLGCLISDADKEAKAALDRPEVREQLVAWWGPQVVGADGSVDRKAVAGVVFADEAERKRLEGLTHPIVRAQRGELFERAEREGVPGVVIDAPLLFEAGLDDWCDAVIFVDCPREVRLERVIATRGWDQAELARRERAQMPLDEKRARSRFIVDNSGSEERLVSEVRAAFEAIRGAWAAGRAGGASGG